MRNAVFLGILILGFVATCAETDMYVPAFPNMLEFFATTEAKLQLILGVNFIGICIGSLFYGPASDSFGRRSVMLFCTTLFVVGGLGCVFSNTIEGMIFWRFIQGVGGSGPMTVGCAAIFDRMEAERAAKVMAVLNTLVVALIAGAPVLGGWLNATLGWRSNFIAIAALGAAFLFCLVFFFEEPLEKERRKVFNLRMIMRDYLTMFKSLPFMANTLICSLLFGGFFVYVANLSLIFVNHLGVDDYSYRFYQASVLFIFFIGSATSVKVIDWIGMERMKNIGSAFIITGAIAFYAAAHLFADSPMILNGAMIVFMIGLSYSIGVFFVYAMEVFPHMNGAASALIQAIRLFLSAFVVWIGGLLFDGTMMPVATMIFMMVALSVGLHILAKRSQRKIQAAVV